jgi:hypothetical protein
MHGALKFDLNLFAAVCYILVFLVGGFTGM